MNAPQPISVVVTGAAGKMGRAITAAVLRSQKVFLAGATEAAGHARLGEDPGVLAAGVPTGVRITDALATLLGASPVVIDFTEPAATMAHLRLCRQERAPMVIGTTGLSEAEKAEAAAAGREIPIVMAPNMSVGVNLLFYLVSQAAAILGESFDIEIVEAHHRQKKDAPSGTALRLAEVASTARKWRLSETARFCREGMIGPRPDQEIGIQTVRAGDIVGEHTVILAGAGERLELIHRAHSRDTFAQGAVRAAEWIAHQSPGLYDMADVLGLKRP